MEGKVISGFGRGSKELGIPTANLPVDATVTPWIEEPSSRAFTSRGGRRCVCRIRTRNQPADEAYRPGSPSIRWSCRSATTLFTRTFTVRSAEVHLLHKFSDDFYGVEMRLLLAGSSARRRTTPGLEALIEDINIDQ